MIEFVVLGQNIPPLLPIGLRADLGALIDIRQPRQRPVSDVHTDMLADFARWQPPWKGGNKNCVHMDNIRQDAVRSESTLTTTGNGHHKRLFTHVGTCEDLFKLVQACSTKKRENASMRERNCQAQVLSREEDFSCNDAGHIV